MPADPGYRPFAPADAQALAYLVRHGFGIPAEDVEGFRDLLGDHAFRVLVRNGRPVASGAVWPMDQWFGGRPVPSLAVNQVTTDPAARGRGAATALVTSVLEEARAGGAALCVLYSATVPLYAKLGFARAGSAFTWRAPPDALAVGGAEAPLVRMDPLDADLLAALRRREAPAANGMAERTEAMWTMLLRPGDEGPADVFLVPGPGGPEGYVAVLPPRGGRLAAVDLCVPGRRAARPILGFLAGYRGLVDTVTWPGGPDDPLVHLARDSGAGVAEWDEWLLRVIDVAAALEARGYPAGLEATLVLDVGDPVLAANHGRFRLTVAGGEGRVERLPGDGPGEEPADLTLSVAALAPLFSGHLAPAALRRTGGLDGGDAALATAALVFAGPRPWMADRF